MFRKQIIQQLLLLLLINNYQDFLNQCCTVSVCKTSSSNASHLTVSDLHENEFVYSSQRWNVKILLCFWNDLCTLTAQKEVFFLAKTRGCVPGAFTTLTGHETRQLFFKLICDGSMKVFFLNLIKDTSWSTWNLKTQELSTTSLPKTWILSSSHVHIQSLLLQLVSVHHFQPLTKYFHLGWMLPETRKPSAPFLFLKLCNNNNAL